MKRQPVESRVGYLLCGFDTNGDNGVSTDTNYDWCIYAVRPEFG